MKKSAFLCVACLVSSVTAFVVPGTQRAVSSSSSSPSLLLPLSPRLAVKDIKKHHHQRTHVHHLYALPPPHFWTSLVPPLLGLYKSEWTVSLGYGTAVAWTAATLAQQFSSSSSSSSWAVLHAGPLIAYGLRLNLFLILRNLFSPRIQDSIQRIEDRALARGNRFTTRLPFILSCGLLYYGLAIPVWCTGTFFTTTTTSLVVGWKQETLLKTLIAFQWLGFGIAAMGDFTKSYVKAREKNERFLVTSGIFSWVRHPNYTGEIVGWTANALLGLVAAIGLQWGKGIVVSPVLVTNVAMLLLGWIGIVFVLLRATTNLEARQAKDYGRLEKYQLWRSTSWGGWQLPTTQSSSNEPVIPHLELDEDSVQESGSGI